MLDTMDFGCRLKAAGFDFFAGVPCSFLNPLINYALNECDYIMAATEADAVATAAGAYLAGKKPVVLMQNSGLANAVSSLTSLAYVFRIPILGFVSWRGEPGLSDEPQHELMGPITADMLHLMRIRTEILSEDPAQINEQLNRAQAALAANESFFFIVRKGTFSKISLRADFQENTAASTHDSRIMNGAMTDTPPTREDALRRISHLAGSQIITLATTGFSGRELYEAGDKENNLYMVGSMGCVSSLALGMARNTARNVFAVDGDGALLMRMGNLAVNAFYAPANMLHILLDNRVYDSTGGQATVASCVRFPEMAAAAGYPLVYVARGLSEMESFILDWNEQKKLAFLYLAVTPGARKDLGRPKIKPSEVAQRMKGFLHE
ncbi:MAG: phosphonopyruvate decarboxylase [Planctomycetia bacterium]|nr:phosphonopyruvate decarboxylase [Planctomycetia bacterium]